MDSTQFILAIAANIATLIIMWAYNRSIRGVKNSLTSGTITEKVSNIFTAKRINILGSLSAALLNLWTLFKFAASQPSFTRFELLAAIALSLLTFYWTERIAVGLRATTERRLEATRQDLLGAQTKLGELEERRGADTAEFTSRLGEEARKRKEAEERLERLSKRVSGRGLSTLEPLIEAPSAAAEILYQKEDPEAYRFASNLHKALSSYGWEVALKPLLPDESNPDVPSALAAGGGRNAIVTILASKLEDWESELNTPYTTLVRWLLANDLGPCMSRNESLPDDFFRIIVGPKP